MSIQVLKMATAAVVLTMAAGSAQAHGVSPAAVVVQQATADPADKSAEKKYCVRTTITGSRMAQKVCRTRKAWLAEGFDPKAPQN